MILAKRPASGLTAKASPLPSQVHALPILPMCARLHLPSHHFCYGNSHLPLWSIVRRQLITSDAKSASAVQIDAVQAEFAKTGIPAEVSQKLVKQYKPYLNWDIETKLRPALQPWLQELGTEQLSQQLQKSRHLLLRKPDDCIRVSLWLSSMGVDAGQVQRKAPQVMLRELLSVQQMFETLQQAAAFSDAQMCTFLHRHPAAFASEPDRVLHSLEVVSMLLDAPMTSDNIKETVLTASERLFLMSLGALHQHVAFFCQMYGTGIHVARTAIAAGLTLDDIAARPKLLACSVSGYLGPRVCFMYQTGAIEAPASVMTSGRVSHVSSGSNTQLSNRFSSPASNPSVVFDSAFIDHWKRRWDFLSQHMKLSVETIAAHQDLLLTSLPDRLAPRWQLLSSIANEQADLKAEDHLTALTTLSDQDFAQAFKADEISECGLHA